VQLGDEESQLMFVLKELQDPSYFAGGSHSEVHGFTLLDRYGRQDSKEALSSCKTLEENVYAV
jgi:hypothetical protein